MGQTEEAAKKQFEKAEQALKKHNLQYAIELYLQGLLMHPNAAEERRRLHQVETLAIQEQGGNPLGGWGVKLKVLGHETQVKKFHLQKKYDEEIVELEKILRFQPQNPNSLMALGNVLELKEYWDSAITTYEEVLGTDKTTVEAYRRLGKIFAEHKNDPEKAIEFWEKVRQYKPDDKEAGKEIRNLSAATMVKKAEERKEQSGDESFRAMLKDQAESDELQKKQQIARTDEDRKRAIKFKVDEIKKDPKNSRLYRELGILYQELEMWEMAEKVFLKALEVNPTDLYAKEKIGQLKETRLDKELEAIGQQANGSNDPKLKERLKAKEAEVLGFKIQEYQRRVKDHPTDYALKYKCGVWLRKGHRIDDAIGMFQKALKDPKQKVSSKKEIGECFVEKGLFDMAKTQFGEAIEEIGDKESDLWKRLKYNLGLASESNNELEEAIKHYQEIMAIDIGYLDVSERVTELRKKLQEGS